MRLWGGCPDHKSPEKHASIRKKDGGNSVSRCTTVGEKSKERLTCDTIEKATPCKRGFEIAPIAIEATVSIDAISYWSDPHTES